MEVVSVIATIGGYFVDPIKKHCGHLFHYNSNIKNLEDRIGNLCDKKDGVQSKIDAEKRNGQVILPEVEGWVEKARNTLEEARNILDEDAEANKKGLDGVHKVLWILRGEVLEAQRADKVNMIAICGMGGIGKTTMAKEVAKRAKDDKLFDEVVMVVASQNQDLRKIQVQIAEMLGLQLVEENPLVRAERLNKRLSMDSKSVLVMLDDVWDALDLEAVGIPYGGEHNRCKILLTSRSEVACTQMKTQKIFPIKVLFEEEAWNLFRRMAGNCIDTPNLHPIAKEVAEECGGLPVAIVTVGRALENKSEFEWSAALQQLKNAIPKNIPGLDSKVYSSIELSYGYLKSDEAKSCFLLCCLFPEDYDILIELLVRYGVGQRLFAKIDTVAEARNRVHAIKIKVFLYDVRKKMEEWPEKDSCERSTAISLLTEELKRHPDGLECPKLELLQLSFDSDTSQMLPHNLLKGMKRLKVLSLFGTSLPQSINVLQNLRTLQFVGCEITDVSAIGELRKLEILSFIGSKIKELPREMRNLSCLKLLELTGCSDLERIPPDLLSSLSHLEELYMFGVDVKWEPMEQEEVDEEEEEEYQEEEEEVDEEGEEKKKGANASLTELMSLSYLVALKIQIPNIKVLPKDLPFKNETIKFQIFAGNNVKIDERNFKEYYDYLIKNRLGLASCDVSDIAQSRMLLQLFKKSEILRLKEIKDLKNIVYELDKEGFQCLKVLRVVGSEDVEYVMDATSYLTPRAAFPILESLKLEGLINLKEIYHSQFPDRSSSGACFGSLKSLRLRTLPRLIGFCTGVGPVELVQPSLNQEVGRIGTDEKHKMTDIQQHIGTDEVTNLEKHRMTDIQQHIGPFPESTPIISHKLFSSNTILWPPDLEYLELTKADSLEVVFDLEGLKVDKDRQRIAVLAQLKILGVYDLSKLTYVWKNVPLGIQGFQKLTSIEVSKCHRLRCLFPTSIAKLLVELQSIKINECDAIENIVQRDGEEEATDIILFPRVSSLKLRELPNMMSFCIKTYSFEWSSIKEIYLDCCPKLKTIGSEIQSPRKSKKVNRELDSRPHEQKLGSPGFLWRCLECVPRLKNYGLMAVSDQGTTNKSQRSYYVKEEPMDPKVSDSNNPLEIWSFFPSHIIECLKNLELIKLRNVASLEVLFQLEELNVEESHMAPVLDQLRNLGLNDLPKLMHIWKKGPERILGFGNLRLLEVWECNSLTYLFSPSIAKLLVMLEKIVVNHCEKIEEIIVGAGEEEKEKDVLFDKVNSIMLLNLPNLKCFCNEANALEWPSLKEIIVHGCPSLSTFIPSNLSTPKLEGVYDALSWEKERMCHWKGDLNATIEHIFKGKEKQVNHKTQQEEQIEIIEVDM
uniref:AAA+ ATPase domain-containing protein n=1 Tax=Quercus lobata TaxID=97700 RepID=A0A7N2R7H7_QUELO